MSHLSRLDLSVLAHRVMTSPGDLSDGERLQIADRLMVSAGTSPSAARGRRDDLLRACHANHFVDLPVSRAAAAILEAESRFRRRDPTRPIAPGTVEYDVQRVMQFGNLPGQRRLIDILAG